MNNSDITIKINRRQWIIYDVGFGFTEVIGDGIIGLTPTLEPGESFKYFSNVALRSGVGNMKGFLFAADITNEVNLILEIPKFDLMAEVLSN